MKDLQIQVEKWVDQQMPGAVEDLKRICRIKSIAEPQNAEVLPFGQGCIDVLEEMLKMGEEAGFETHNYENYVGKIICRGQTEENIGIWSHLDVVDVREGWTYPPFEPTVRDGYFIARGCQDNKSSAIVGFYALKYLKEHGIIPKHTMELYLGTCEEKGMFDIDYFLEHYQAPAFSLVPDSGFPVCCGERGSFNGELRQDQPCSNILGIDCHCDLYTVPEKVELFLKNDPEIKTKCIKALENCVSGDIQAGFTEERILITASGISTQAANPFQGKNALSVLADFICQNEILEGTEREAFLLAGQINEDYRGTALGVNCEDELSGPIVLTGTRMRVEEGHLIIDFISKYPVTRNDFPFEEQAAQAAEKRGFALKVTRFGKASWFDPERSEVKIMTKVSNQVLGRNDKPFIMSGGTYARKLPNAVACGTGFPLPPLPEELFLPGHGDYHQPDESIALERIRKGMIIYIMGLLEIDQ